MAKNTTANIAHTLVMNLAVNPLGESTWTAAWKRTAQKFQQNWIKMWFIFIETKKIVLLFTCPHQPSHTELLTQYLEIDALSMIVNQMKLVILEKKSAYKYFDLTFDRVWHKKNGFSLCYRLRY